MRVSPTKSLPVMRAQAGTSTRAATSVHSTVSSSPGDADAAALPSAMIGNGHRSPRASIVVSRNGWRSGFAPQVLDGRGGSGDEPVNVRRRDPRVKGDTHVSMGERPNGRKHT